ncbi:MAG: ATP-binding cassette domain-containing protein [Alphaproteobacteria bacterium]|nr:ATP-binding cassette domain-containing protein [Alphaproteobacteria bacterium]
MLLKIEHLHKNYGSVHALDDVSLSLESGTVLGIVGDNGAGKSTLMKCITGSETASGGSIVLDNSPLPKGNPYASREAGIEMIYQNLGLCLQQDVVENIFLGREKRIKVMGLETPLLDLKGMEREAQTLIGRLNAEINVRKKAGALSGGQQQAVAIARALLFQPRLLIMDEPTAALGVREVAIVLDLIRALKKQGIAVILVSHRLGDIFEVADRIVLMRHGRLIEDKLITETSLSELTQKILCAGTLGDEN